MSHCAIVSELIYKLILLLSDAVDRNHLASSLQRCSNMSDDEPLYDAVAEDDDDYAALAPVALQVKLVRQRGVKNYSFG